MHGKWKCLAIPNAASFHVDRMSLATQFHSLTATSLEILDLCVTTSLCVADLLLLKQCVVKAQLHKNLVQLAHLLTCEGHVSK